MSYVSDASGMIVGVTLIEMIITLSVLSVVLALAAPSVARWVRQTEVRSSAESLRSALQQTRAEAVARNARMRVTFGDAKGRPQWTIGCVRVNAACPAQLVVQPVSQGSARWGAASAGNVSSAGAGGVSNAGGSTGDASNASSSNASDLKTALEAGAALPGSVDFFPLGDAPQVVGGTDISRIDIAMPSDDSVRRLVVRIDSAGNVSLCDPLLAATEAGACH